MSETTVAEPPTKRQRAENDDNGNGEKEGEPKDDDEFLQLQAVSVVQEELNDLEEEEANEVLAVHKAFLKRKRPLYARRQEAISKVPNFWLRVLLAHPLTQLYVTGNDHYPLSYLEAISISKSTSGINLLAIQEQQEEQQENGAGKAKGVVGEQEGKEDKKPEVDDDDDGVGFRVTFTFRENPFFTNECLWKEWESMLADQAMFSEVNWKDTEESRELQALLVWNMDPNTTEEKEPPSFFSIFCEDVEDYEFGEALRGEIIENPLDIYMRHDLDVTEEGADQEGFPPHEEAFVEDGFEGTEYGEYPEEEGDFEQTGEEFHEGAREEEGANGGQQS